MYLTRGLWSYGLASDMVIFMNHDLRFAISNLKYPNIICVAMTASKRLIYDLRFELLGIRKLNNHSLLVSICHYC